MLSPYPELESLESHLKFAGVGDKVDYRFWAQSKTLSSSIIISIPNTRVNRPTSLSVIFTDYFNTILVSGSCGGRAASGSVQCMYFYSPTAVTGTWGTFTNFIIRNFYLSHSPDAILVRSLTDSQIL